MYFEDAFTKRKILKKDIDYFCQVFIEQGKKISLNSYKFNSFLLEISTSNSIDYQIMRFCFLDKIKKPIDICSIYSTFNKTKNTTRRDFGIQNEELFDNMLKVFNSYKLQNQLQELLSSKQEAKKIIKV